MTIREVIAASGVPVAPFVLVFGLLVGSFLNVVIARMPLGESIVRPRSRCPKCGYMIPSWLNVPVLSWLALRGKCASCKTPISVRYPVVELLTGVLFLACYRQFGLSWALLLGMIFSAGLLVITFVDIDWWEIPDEISWPGTFVGIVLRPIAFEVPWWSGLVAALLAAVALLSLRWGFATIRAREGMGLGDVKLLAMIGAFLGTGALLPVLLVASISGLLVGVPLAALGHWRGEDEEEEEEEEEEEVPKSSLHLLVLLQSGRRTRRLGGGEVPATRTHLRAGLVFGARRAGGPGFRLVVGLLDSAPGFGCLDGATFGLHRGRWGRGLKLWLGVMAGPKVDPREEDEDSEVEWERPQYAVPFGPFLAIGALFTLLFGHSFPRWLMLLTS